MKKILVMLMVALFATNVNAQIALQEQKPLDNTYIGVTAGVSTPLSFNSMFPINPEFGLKVGKDFTPIYSLEIEGITFLGSNSDNGHFDLRHTAFRAINLGLNGKVNLHSLVYGYKNRVFNLSTVTGFGWFHTFNANTNDYDGLSAKTGVQGSFNLGKGHALFVEPAVLWNLNNNGFTNVKFNKNHAQLLLNVGYTYHFKTSNGTHSFKKYNIGAMNDEINYLRNELAKKPTTIVKTNEVTVTNTVRDEYVIYFAQNSYDIVDFYTLDMIPANSKVTINGYASPEGTDEHNYILSEKRAYSVANYLANKGIEVVSCKGNGVVGNNSNRVVVVNIQ